MCVKKASFAQCSLVEYSLEFEIKADSDSTLIFDAQNITKNNHEIGFVDNLKVALDQKFKEVEINAPGLAYIVPKGQYNLVVTSSNPFTLSIMDSKKLLSTKSLSGQNVYAPILQKDITYEQFIDKTQYTKDATCQETFRQLRQHGSHWFANEYIVVSNIPGLDQDTTHKKLFLEKKHIATIMPYSNSHRSIASSELKSLSKYQTLINHYTGQEITIYINGQITTQTDYSGTKKFQTIRGDAIFPEPLIFNNIQIAFEPIENVEKLDFLLDNVKKIIENIEPASYKEIILK